MKLFFDQEFKSIPIGGETELPRFCVLTGLNGSGKSHLLKAIENGKIRVEAKGAPVSGRRYINSIDFVPKASLRSNPQTSEQAYTLLLQWCDQLVQQGQNIATADQYIAQKPKNVRDAKQQSLFPILRKLLQISFDEDKRAITRFDIKNSVRYSELEAFDEASVFHQKFSMSFLRYFQDRELNQFAQFKVGKGDTSVKALSDDEFIALKGRPPWELINKMLVSMELPYEINAPTSADNTFTAKLTHACNGTTIDFMDLSSGEQVLCSIAIALYQLSENSSFPDLLLLDEPDAHLHPKMVDSMLNVLREEILPELSCGLIITTHSPSTCVLAAPESLYRMEDVSRRPIPSSPDEALGILSVGVPTLSIRKENSKQVVVESDADATIYQGLWSTLRRVDRQIQGGVNLNFISSKSGWRTGSCEHARRICEAFRNAGSTSTFALIDYDNRNVSQSPIYVAGGSERYSIENYIHIPIAISGLLIHYLGRDHKDLPDFLKGFDKSTIGNASGDEIQKINDGFCSQLRSEIGQARNNGNLLNKFPEIDIDDLQGIMVSDFAGRNYTLPSWFLKSNGHKLEEAIAVCYPRLSRYQSRQKAGELMFEIRTHVFDCNPGLIPAALVSTFRDIQSA